ncbi:formate--phosphoribosylaminoimidazolecarboxamide ligase [Geoglobus acetivorans]|uniref:5-formaminoimidazole-4-carboxamide-1-(beta)-D-ribofuranosyl 5'-monophosphate synthetase n=1 Tax=Geoglobus acetivorans TaxID=565033 RepID=A0ABZ3H6N4_GEOAI|nr:formate--phosphoribosylaminoimidazolecarboxamide ligase [Geoglobus acetivorans]
MEKLRELILATLKNYDKENIRIGTIGSHSALNILKGAKEEGFETVCIVRKRESFVYRNFGVADHIIEVDDFRQLLDDGIQKKLIEMNTILIPHGSYNAYIGSLYSLKVPVFGNRILMEWETVREKQRDWLVNSGLNVPKTYRSPDEIDGLAIVKYPGARGGKGYFIAASKEDFLSKAEELVKRGIISKDDINKAHIQEYVLGVPVYFSFFYSPVNSRIELIAIDRRYESNVDGFGRIPADEQLKTDLIPTYTVVGNIPLIVRESLLSRILQDGEQVYEYSRKIAEPGMVGPFCLESVIDENGTIYYFEISARIVAGSSVGIPASPYSYILFGENMYMGRRIAREIRIATEKDMLEELIF